MSKQLNHIYEFGDFRLETAEQLLLRQGSPVPLTRKAFDTLLVLVQSSGHVVEKEELMKRVWADAFVEETNLARNVWALRKALGDDNREHQYIETIPKLGYRFLAPVKEVEDNDTGILIQRRMRARIVREEQEISDAPPSEIEIAHTVARPVDIAAEPKSEKVLGRRVVGAVLAFVVLAVVVGVWFSIRRGAPTKIESIAVLPFRPLTQEENNQALGLGLTDALITKLGSVRLLTVRPTSAVVKFAKSDLDALEIGSRLKTDAVLDGTIQQSEGRIRITARLLNVASGQQIWAEKFDDSSHELFTLQDALANKITKTLAFELEKPELEQLASRPTRNSEAYEKYLQGRFYQTQNTEQGFTRSLECYEQAIALDPNFADAYAGIADSHLLLYNFGLRPPAQVIPKARQALTRALQLNPNLADVYNSLALIQFFSEHDWKAAEQSLQKAIALDPHSSDAFLRYGYFLIIVGRFDEALSKLGKARELNPLSQIVQADIGLAYLSERHYPEAVGQLERVAAENPDFPLVYWFLSAAYEGGGDADKAFVSDLRAMEAGGDGQLASRLRAVKEKDGLPSANQLWLDEWLKERARGYVSALDIASRYATFKNREQTLAWLEKSLAEGEQTLAQIRFLASYDFVRDDERFQKIVKKISFGET